MDYTDAITLLIKHPELRDLVHEPGMRCFKVLDDRNLVTEQWERDEDGNWVDVTERELARQELQAAQDELARIALAERKAAKRAGGAHETTEPLD